MAILPLLALLLAAPAPSALDKAEAAYFAGDFDPAAALLDQADAEIAKSVEPSPDRARALLLRAAVELKRNRHPAAEEAAKAALSIDPDLNAEAYPPSVRKLLDSMRLSLPPRALLRFSGVPEGGEVRLDGRLLPGSGVLAVLPGAHRLVVRLPEGGEVKREVAVRSDATVDLGWHRPSLSERAWNDRRAGPFFLGLGALALVGAVQAQQDLLITRANQSGVPPGGNRSVYDSYATGYQLEMGACLALAIASGYLGVNRLHASHLGPSLHIVPRGDGASVLLSGSFRGP